jgi:diguanylate cyclase (GGDEF)-like protein
MLVLLLLILLVAMPVLIELAHGFNRPVQALAGAVQQLAAGIYDAPLPTVADTNLTKLIVAFDNMRHGRREAEVQLERQALHDSLTGLPNRVLLHDRLDQALRVTKRYSDSTALLFLDLDRFKAVNDGYGHHTGDLLLIEISRRLAQAVRASDTIARLGGDEFAVLLLKSDAAGAMTAARALRAAVIEPVVIDGYQLSVDVSIGIAVSPEHGTDAQLLMQHADLAMYAAKAAGGGATIYRETLAVRRINQLAEPPVPLVRSG